MTLAVLFPVVVIFGLATAVEYIQHRERDLTIMSLLSSQTGAVIESALAQDMLNSDFGRIQQTFDAIGQDDRIRTLYLLDPQGRVIFSPGGAEAGAMLNNEDPSCQPCHSRPTADRPASMVVTNTQGQRVFRTMRPIENRPACTRCHAPGRRINGLLLVDLSIEPVQAALTADLRDNILWWIGTTLLVLGVTHVALRRFVLIRVGELDQALERFGDVGEGVQLAETPDDEIGRLSAAFNRMAGRVREREGQVRELSRVLERRMRERGSLLRRLISVQEEERKRVARELHDELGQRLSSTVLAIGAAERLLQRDPEAARDVLRSAREALTATTEQMYNLILGLRPSALDDLGLEAALRAHAHRTLEAAGVTLHMSSERVDGRLAPEAETALFRIFQEALTNVVRHAQARHVHLSLRCADGCVIGELRDDGRGFDPASLTTINGDGRGLGLLGMRERVELCGGSLEIDSRPGAGTRLCVRVPYTVEHHA